MSSGKRSGQDLNEFTLYTVDCQVIGLAWNSFVAVQEPIINKCHIRTSWPYMVNGGKSYTTCSLNSRCHWSIVGKCITVTGTLAHSYFLLPDLWVCKPCTSYVQNTSYVAVLFLNSWQYFAKQICNPDLSIHHCCYFRQCSYAYSWSQGLPILHIHSPMSHVEA